MFGTCVQEWQVHGGAAAFQGMPVADLSFANDDRYIVTSSPDASIPLYNLYDSSAPPTVLPALKSGNVVCVDWHSRYVREWCLAKRSLSNACLKRLCFDLVACNVCAPASPEFRDLCLGLTKPSAYGISPSQRQLRLKGQMGIDLIFRRSVGNLYIKRT